MKLNAFVQHCRRGLLICLLSGVYRSASADPVLTNDYRLSGNGQLITFSLPQSPTVSSFISSFGFEIDDVTVLQDGISETANIVFTRSADGVAFAIGTDASLLQPFGVYGGYPSIAFLSGPLLYSGSEQDPSLLTGGFNLQEFGSDPPVNYGLLVTPTSVAPTPIPEPSAVVLLGTGMIGMLSTLRRRTAGRNRRGFALRDPECAESR